MSNGFDALTRALVFNKIKGLCFYCGRALPSHLRVALWEEEDWQIDHVVPVSQGGSNALDNLIPSCARCNRSKGDLTAKEFIRREMLSRTLRPPTGFPIS